MGLLKYLKGIRVIWIFIIGTVLYFVVSLFAVTSLYTNLQAERNETEAYRDSISVQQKELFRLADVKRDH